MVKACLSGEELGRTGGWGEMEVAIKVLKMQWRMAGVKKKKTNVPCLRILVAGGSTHTATIPNWVD